MEPFRGSVILIRHADVTPDPAGDPDPGPPLNAAGAARARELCHVLSDTGIGAILVTHFRRSRQTAEPLEQLLGIAATVIDDDTEVVAAIRTFAASSVPLVIGHSNTVPAIIAHLGGPSLPVMPATEFDNLFVLSSQRLTHLRYGA
jgi:broad specificity phosphatase PhoE